MDDLDRITERARSGNLHKEADKLARQHKLFVRDRIALLCDKESFVDISNVQLIDPQSGRPTRVKYQVENDGSKTRVAAASGHSLEK